MTADTDQFDDLNIIARTAWGENRSLGHDGMQGTINSGQNRLASGVRWWESWSPKPADILRSVFLHHEQYSCWDDGDPNRAKLMAVTAADPQFAIALLLATAALAGTLPDITNGADSYVAGSLKVLPRWTNGLQPVALIGGTKFYRTVAARVS